MNHDVDSMDRASDRAGQTDAINVIREQLTKTKKHSWTLCFTCSHVNCNVHCKIKLVLVLNS